MKKSVNSIEPLWKSRCDTEKFVLALNTATDGGNKCYEEFLDDQRLFKKQTNPEICNDRGEILLNPPDQTVIEVVYDSTCLVTSDVVGGEIVYKVIICEFLVCVPSIIKYF